MPSSTDFTCPSCQEKFDSEIRSPFVGCCGHSLCAICVNENDITTCPICNTEGAFTVKKKDDLAAGLLDALAKIQESLVPAILKPKNRAFLPQSVNLLDRSSFVKFSRTCKYIHELCFKSSEIRITYDIPCIVISLFRGSLGFETDGVKAFPSEYTPFNYTGNDRGFLGSAENRKNLRKNYPFVFKLAYLDLSAWRYDEDAFLQIRSFFEDFPIRKVSVVQITLCTDWHVFAQFVKDYKTGELEIATDERDGVIFFPDDVANCLLQNTIRFSGNTYISDEVILEAPLPRLYLSNARISQYTFVILLERFANSTEKIEWTLRCEPFEFGHYGIFTTEYVNSFDDEPLSSERPLILVGNSDWYFQILREDGKRLRCYLWQHYIHFTTFADY